MLTAFAQTKGQGIRIDRYKIRSNYRIRKSHLKSFAT